jgi:hypothetical protein
MQALNLAGDKTAYLVTDLTVTPLTVIQENQDFKVNNCHAWNPIFFLEYTVHGQKPDFKAVTLYQKHKIERDT